MIEGFAKVEALKVVGSLTTTEGNKHDRNTGNTGNTVPEYLTLCKNKPVSQSKHYQKHDTFAILCTAKENPVSL